MSKFFDVYNVCFSYYRKPLCLKDIKFTLNENDNVLLLAPEEMGKTTFLKVLSSFEDKYFGKILYKEKDLKLLGDEEKKFSLIFAVPVFIKGTIRKNFDYLCETSNLQKLENDELKDVLKKFGIERNESEKIKKLTLLEKRLLSLARCYTKNPSIVFVDDIFVGLEKEEQLKLFNSLKILLDRQTCVLAFGNETFKEMTGEIQKIKLAKVFYLNNANFYEYGAISEFLNSGVDFMSLSFKKGWQSDIGVIVKNFNEYYFAFEEPNFYKLDKKFYSKLDALKLDEGDTDNVYFVSNIDFDISKLENSELNQKLENAEFMIFSELDGTRVI